MGNYQPGVSRGSDHPPSRALTPGLAQRPHGQDKNLTHFGPALLWGQRWVGVACHAAFSESRESGPFLGHLASGGPSADLALGGLGTVHRCHQALRGSRTSSLHAARGRDRKAPSPPFPRRGGGCGPRWARPGKGLLSPTLRGGALARPNHCPQRGGPTHATVLRRGLTPSPRVPPPSGKAPSSCRPLHDTEKPRPLLLAPRPPRSPPPRVVRSRARARSGRGAACSKPRWILCSDLWFLFEWRWWLERCWAGVAFPSSSWPWPSPALWRSTRRRWVSSIAGAEKAVQVQVWQGGARGTPGPGQHLHPGLWFLAQQCGAEPTGEPLPGLIRYKLERENLLVKSALCRMMVVICITPI